MRDFQFQPYDQPSSSTGVASTASLPLQTYTEMFSVPSDLIYLEGHFPGSPIVPGVAQVVALAERRAHVAWPELGAAVGLRRVKFKKGLYPGDRLVLRLARQDPRVNFRIESIAEGDEPPTLFTQGTVIFAKRTD